MPFRSLRLLPRPCHFSPVATAELRSSLEKFAAFARSLHGDEKSEAQGFLERFFRALGHEGVMEAGATFEFRIAKKPGTAQLELIQGEGARAKGGKKFADLLWPERVLIEMKSRGAKLERHYDQAFDYWTHIVPHRPPYVILCNFDEFWIYDFNQQLFDPVERVSLRELSDRATAFNFLLPHAQKPHFGNNRVEVTRKAADTFAEVFRKIIARGEDRTRAQRFILQLLVSVVAEDLGLLPGEIVTSLLADCVEKPADSYDLLGGLFRQMASAEKARGGRYADVAYFNGGLFAIVDPIELKHGEAYALHEAAQHNDWSLVKPEIFGTLFQHSMGEKARHALGAHFTHEFDIHKVVGPTIVRPWRERMDAAGKDPDKLRAVLDALRCFRVLDPACGSGNFLFVAYREIKRLERDLLLRLHQALKAERAKGIRRERGPEELTSAVSIRQFFGMDIDPFAVELTKVTLMLAKELEIREAARFGESEGIFFREAPLPLDNLDANILCADALFTEWPAADVIIGNPPYLGSRYLAKEHGYDYANKIYARFPGVPKMADFCTHWFRLAHDALQPCTAQNLCAGRAGLVGTNTIRQNESREASLDYIVENGGVITEAISTQVWSGDAAVHVSIVNWLKASGSTKKWGARAPSPAVSGAPPETSDAAGEPAGNDVPRVPESPAGAPGTAGGAPALPDARRSSFRLTFQRGDSVDSPWETHELPVINPALSIGTDVTGARVLAANEKAKKCYTGQNPVNAGFFLTPEEAADMIRADARNREVIFPYMIGRDLVEDYGPTRWIIDFAKRDQFAARSYALPWTRVQERVMPVVLAKAEAEKKAQGKEVTRYTRIAARWWQFYDYRPGTIAAINSVPRWIALSRTSKRPIFEFISQQIHADSKLMVFAFADDYSFGILSSELHWQWTLARGGTLESRPCYTSDTIFDTYPWPQKPKRGEIAEVAAAAVALRTLRREVMAAHGWSLRELYRTLDEPGDNPLRTAHARLDTAVRAAYAMPKTADPLAFLLALNLDLAAKESAGEKITPPGLALPEKVCAALITQDCIGVPEPS